MDGTMGHKKDAKAEGEQDFETQWDEYWEHMRELNQGLEEQQSVSSKTLNLVFRV